MNRIFHLLSILVVGSSLAASSQLRTINGKVNIAVYYESQCPDSRRFINNQLPKAIETFPDLVNIILIPFGKANYTWVSDSSSWYFQCQHGPEECYGNAIQGCVIYYRPKLSDHFDFINCAMSNITGSRLQNAIECNEKYPIAEFNDVIECANGSLGNQILYANGIRTHALIPSLYYVPWIIFDNVYTNETRIQAEQDIIKAICNQFNSTNLPPECPKIDDGNNSAMTNMRSNFFMLISTVVFALFYSK